MTPLKGSLQGKRFWMARHAALKVRAEGDILVLPERAIRLGGSGGEILRLCQDGGLEEEIVRTLRARYPDTPEIEAEVERFLSEMLELGGLSTQEPTEAQH